MSTVLDPAVANPGEETRGSVAAMDRSALGQCLNGDVAVFLNLALPGFPDSRVAVRRNGVLRDDDPLPFAVFSHYRFIPANEEGSNRENCVHYQNILSLYSASGRDAINGEGDAFEALEEVYVAFSKKPTRAMGFEVNAGGASCLQTTVIEAEALNEEAFRMGVNARFLIIDHKVRLPYSSNV